MLIASLLLLLVQTPPPAAAAQPIQRPLFAAEKWYQDAKGEEKLFEGVLEINPGEGRIGVPAPLNSFRLIALEEGRPIVRQIHTSGKDYLLSPFIGHNIKLTAKLGETGVNGETRMELWPARIEVLGLAPAGVIAEWKIIARANYIPPQVRFNQPLPTVIRDAKQLAQFMQNAGSETAATTQMNQHLKPASIDWNKHVLINISGGSRSGAVARIVITKITFGEKGLDVHWEQDNQNFGGGRSAGETVLVNKYDGDIRFIQKGSSKIVTVPGPAKTEGGPKEKSEPIKTEPAKTPPHYETEGTTKRNRQ